MEKVKNRRGARISQKHQITLPVKAMQDASLRVGERLTVRVDGPGRLILEREDDVLSEFAGCLTGVYARDELDRMRDEWR